MTTSRHPNLDRIQTALDAGDVQAARRALLELEPNEETLAREEMGSEAFDRARGAASRGGRRGKLGKVLVLPGIMGSELDSVDRSGDADRIWINFFNLIRGRIDELELTAEGKPAKPGVRVRTAGVHRATYLPLILDLDTRWQVQPFAFDWREDLELSAKRLNDEITEFAAGDPVHLVAHSMGGLVARLFAHRFPGTWKAIADADAPGRGGRLIMLGTPNRGSFAIPLVLTGAEGILKALAVADIPHRMKGILAIVSSFPGLYQMLPSPLVAGAHKKLFKASAWGDFSVHQPLLDRARDFHTELEHVVDPKRLTYVAGYDQRTPVAIRIDAPGRFSYQETLEGDGRVPHAYGLLTGSGVPTYWINESHGDLPKNGRVMDAVSDILERGETAGLPQEKPASRGVKRSAWKSGEDLESVPPEAREILAAARGGRSAGTPRDIGKSAEIRLENLLLADYLGTGDDAARAVVPRPGGPRRPGGPPPAKRRQAQTINLEVVWGDVTQVRADVYCVGHYQGVLPQNAELALDQALSGAQQPGEPDEVYRRRLVITQYTRRGLLDGTLGDVRYFPWKLARENSRIVAVAGMGRPGTFDIQGLRRVANELAFEIGSLPMVETVCTVLIGSGEGSLAIREAVDGILAGLRDAVSARGERWIATLPRKLTIVERNRDRAHEIARAIAIEIPTGVERLESPVRAVRLVCNAGPVPGPGRAISDDDALALLLDSAIAATGKPKSSRQARALSALVDNVSLNADERRLLRSRIAKAGKNLRDERSPDAGVTRFRVERRTQRAVNDAIPVRISFWEEGTVTKVAAITQATTVSERVISVDAGLIDELVDAMTNPLQRQVERLSALLSQLLIPHDFRDTLETGPFVFEVDRAMARVQWEFLALRSRPNGEREPIAVNSAVARQLRTVYSPAPRPPERPRRDLRALVIGDPGDPALGDDLEHARAEALTVCDLLRARNVEVTARIGAPSVPRTGPLHGIAPADRLDVLGLLLEGGFDIIHYAGHGNFDADRPDRAGWVFSSGLLTPHELERVDQIPAIVVANACLSARTSRALAGKRSGKDSRSEAGLLPSLADEFFHLGVRNYIGTAWEVNDIGAQLFAEHFYDALLPTGQDDGIGCSFGEAVRIARRALWEKQDTYGPLWAAYQHYGDPTSEARIIGDVPAGDAAPS